MRKFLLVLLLISLSGCIEVGDFPEDRVKLHEMGQDSDYCQKYPKRCIGDIPW